MKVNNDWSSWRTKINGLVQGSVLSLMLINLYINDQPTPRDTKHLLCAGDLAITAQYTIFDSVEKKINKCT